MHLLVKCIYWLQKSGFYDQKSIFSVFKEFTLFLTSIIFFAIYPALVIATSVLFSFIVVSKIAFPFEVNTLKLSEIFLFQIFSKIDVGFD